MGVGDTSRSARAWSIALVGAPVLALMIDWGIDRAATDNFNFAEIAILLLVPLALVVVTSLMVAVEAPRVGRSRAWALGTLFLWPVIFPVYLAKRGNAGGMRHAAIAIVATIALGISMTYLFNDLERRLMDQYREESRHREHYHTGEFPPF